MFGIGQISWEEFLKFILLGLTLWYLFVLVYALFRQKQGDRKMLFEEDFPGSFQQETFNPVSVSSHDFPAEILPLLYADNIHLPVSLYEETCIDDGYPIECFTETAHPELPQILEEIQYQQ